MSLVFLLLCMPCLTSLPARDSTLWPITTYAPFPHSHLISGLFLNATQFISHDGITTYVEMVDAAQNVYNWHYDLASFVATFGLIQDGDLLTETLSIGCTGGLPVPNTGLNTHSMSCRLSAPFLRFTCFGH